MCYLYQVKEQATFRRFYIPFLAVLVTAFLLSFSHSKSVHKDPLKVVQQEGRSIEIYDFDGLQKIFNYQNDTTYVVNFWSTWCKPCVKELPHFEALAKEMKGDKFKMILVSLDFPAVYEKSLAKFLKNMDIASECHVLDDPDANS